MPKNNEKISMVAKIRELTLLYAVKVESLSGLYISKENRENLQEEIKEIEAQIQQYLTISSNMKVC